MKVEEKYGTISAENNLFLKGDINETGTAVSQSHDIPQSGA